MDSHPSSAHLKATQSISIRAAERLSVTTNTWPQIATLTPQWLLKFLPWVSVETGIYRVNQVKYTEHKHMPVGDKNSVDAGYLRSIPLFSYIPAELMENIVKGLKHKHVKPGEVVIKEGETDDKFYIIRQGELEVSAIGKRGKSHIVKNLYEGDFFGEMALISMTPRQATVTATTGCELIFLDRKTFNQIVKNENIRKQLEEAVSKRRKELDRIGHHPQSMPIQAGHSGEPHLPKGFIDYEVNPREYHLSVIQTIIGIHTRINELYNLPINQLEQQLRVAIENIREREEWEIINNKDFGLLNNAAPNMEIDTRRGPPTPDDFDDLLSLVWKKPSFFVAHPKAIAAFGRECTRRGVPPATVEFFGSPFITWRGIPIVPCDKLTCNSDNGVETTNILLMRVGEDKQGVVGLHKASIGSHKVPSLSVNYMGINEKSIANYLLTKYLSVAALVPDAFAVLRNVELGFYHNYD